MLKHGIYIQHERSRDFVASDVQNDLENSSFFSMFHRCLSGGLNMAYQLRYQMINLTLTDLFEILLRPVLRAHHLNFCRPALILNLGVKLLPSCLVN